MTESKLVQIIRKLKETRTSKQVKKKIKEFKENGRQGINEIFSELCFCLLTANYSAEGGIRIQNSVGKGFHSLSEEKLADKLKKLGHRFPNARACYIKEARRHRKELEKIIKKGSENETREWLVRNIKGIGYKEASHFLRNIGFEDVAIIDFHIVDLLVKHKLIEKPKTLTKNKYLNIEEKLKEIASESGTNLAELDLYLWYLETGKILK